MLRIYKIGKFERGLLFRDNDFVKILQPGWYVFADPWLRLRCEREDVLAPEVVSEALGVPNLTEALKDEVELIELVDSERAFVWVDGRLRAVLAPGRYAYWSTVRKVRVERVDARDVRVDRKNLASILSLPGTAMLLTKVDVPADSVGLYFLNGVFQEQLAPGRYAFWKDEGLVEVRMVDMREQVVEASGQDIMTADKVTLRLNALLTYVVKDALKSLSTAVQLDLAIYRDMQLALRAIVGTKTLDALLEEKDAVATELGALVTPRLEAAGLALVNVGIRDIILPGDMKDLLNRVTEARKAAEANLITRREETAAVRSQLNAARLLEQNPTLMRLRELEVLEKVTEKAKLNVVLGDSGLADKVIKLL